MGRTKSEESAQCPVCMRDFSACGKYRYASLRRHMKSQHPGVTVNNNTLNNTTVNLNVNMNMLMPMSMGDVKKMVGQIIDEINEDPSKVGNLCTFVFKTLHCNPENPNGYVAAIPNVNKDEMIILEEDGKAKVTTCTKGMNKILYRMFDSEMEPFGQLVGHEEFEPVLAHEAQSGVCVPNGIKTLKELPPTQKRDMTKHLKSKLC